MTIAPCILTQSGRMFWPLDPRAEDVCLDDIVDGLANICRFGGQTKPRYSVAQHSVLVSYLAPKRHALWGLMHNAAEALSGFGDIAKPVKQHLLVTYRIGQQWTVEQVEYRILEVIAEALSDCSERADLPWPPPDLKRYDEMALSIERNALMPDHAEWPKKPGWGPEKVPLNSRMRNGPSCSYGKTRTVETGGFIYCWGPDMAASVFMDRYRELRGL